MLGVEWVRRGGDSWRSGGREIMIIIYCMKQNSFH